MLAEPGLFLSPAVVESLNKKPRRLRVQRLTWLLAEQAGEPALDLAAHTYAAHTYNAAHGPAA